MLKLGHFFATSVARALDTTLTAMVRKRERAREVEIRIIAYCPKRRSWVSEIDIDSSLATSAIDGVADGVDGVPPSASFLQSGQVLGLNTSHTTRTKVSDEGGDDST
jgi:hypothetical protein